jgi:hypothetical protein
VTRRLVAVLGYSNGGAPLHPICAARLRRAEAEVRQGDVVLFSGWARRRNGRSEAALMSEAWKGSPVELVVAGDARTTFGNARAAVDAARRFGAEEIVLVTSGWHARRAAALFRAALGGTEIRLALAPAEDAGSRRARMRELVCWLLVPGQARVLGRRRF